MKTEPGRDAIGGQPCPQEPPNPLSADRKVLRANPAVETNIKK